MSLYIPGRYVSLSTDILLKRNAASGPEVSCFAIYLYLKAHGKQLVQELENS